MSIIRSRGGSRREKTLYMPMGHECAAGIHVLGVCSHPGSKPDLYKRTVQRRRQNKAARLARRLNR